MGIMHKVSAQLIERVVFAFVAYIVYQGDSNLLAVKIAAEIKQMSLDREPVVALDGRPVSYIHHAVIAPTVGQGGRYGIDTYRWQEFVVPGKLDIGRRKSQ